MKYKIVLDKPAQKFILKQPLPQQKRILSAINNLPYQGDIKSLRGYIGIYRLRVGNYRVIYSVKDEILTVFVLSVGNRGDVYKQF